MASPIVSAPSVTDPHLPILSPNYHHPRIMQTLPFDNSAYFELKRQEIITLCQRCDRIAEILDRRRESKRWYNLAQYRITLKRKISSIMIATRAMGGY